MKEKVRIKISYFKESGKYYSDGLFECEATIIPEDAPREHRFIYLYDVLDAYREHVAREKESPGLNSDGKDFHKLFEEAEDSEYSLVPHIIPAHS